MSHEDLKATETFEAVVEELNKCVERSGNEQIAIKVGTHAIARFLIWSMLDHQTLSVEAEQAVAAEMLQAGVKGLNDVLHMATDALDGSGSDNGTV